MTNDPDLEQVWFLVDHERYAEAELRVRQVLAERPEDEWALRLLSTSLAGQGRDRDALTAAELACRSHPQQPLSWIQLASIHKKLRDPAAAVAAAQRAVACAPGRADTHLALARAHLTETEPYRPATAHDPESALVAADAAISLSPGDHASHATRAWALVLLGRHREAEAAYRAALALEPNSVAAINGLAWLRHRSRPIHALRGFRAALSLAPQSPVVRINLASALFMWLYRMIWIWLWGGLLVVLARQFGPTWVSQLVVSCLLTICLVGSAIALRRVPSGALALVWTQGVSSSLPLLVRLTGTVAVVCGVALGSRSISLAASVVLVAFAWLEWKVDFSPLGRRIAAWREQRSLG